MTDPAPVLRLINAFRESKVLFTAVELGVFDGCRPSGRATGRLLDACVALGFLERSEGEYRNTPIADEYLSQSSPTNVVGYIRYSNSALYPLWANLKDAILQGSDRWEQTFGRGITVSSYMSNPQRKRDFLAGMHGLGLIAAKAIVTAFDLAAYGRVVDLGGASGYMGDAILAQYPGTQGILFDLPASLEAIGSSYRSKVEIVAGDFFKDELPPGDLFILGRILHSQTDERSLALLRRVYDRLSPGGAVLLAETLLDADGSNRAYGHVQSLNMLVVNSGRDRTFEEYRELLETAGFRNTRSRITGCLLDAILATK